MTDANQDIFLNHLSPGQIFWRNFLAGFSRALGAVVVYIVFLGVMGYFFSRYLWPKIEPVFTMLETSTQLLQTSPSLHSGSNVLVPQNIYTLPEMQQLLRP